MIDMAAIRAAQQLLDGRVHRTPVFRSRTLDERTGATVLLKAECLQRTGSFKARGALNRLLHLTPDERRRGLVAVSAGNHAQAVAWAAREEGLHAVVVMPEHASPAKVDASRAYGADIVLHGDVFTAFVRMDELRREHGYVVIHPFDHPHLMAGQGTAAVELIEDAGPLDAVIVPVGGGGLISGVAAAVRGLAPRARVVGVEPVGAAAMRSALAAGAPVRLERVATIADGLGAPSTSELALEHVRALVDDVVTVSDESIAAALRLVLERCKLLLEPAGAAGIAALLDGIAGVRPGERVGVILSGGNFDLARLGALLQPNGGNG